MNSDASSDADNFVRQVATTFEQMPVPDTPPVSETTAFVLREVSAQKTIVGGRASAPAICRFSFSKGQRLAIGGIGLSAAAALVILLLALNSGRELSAMERLTRQLREVKSYSYKISSRAEFVDEKTNHPVVIIESGHTYWLAPSAFRDERKIVRLDKSAAAEAPAEELLEDFVDVSPAEKPGIFLDIKRKTYVHTPNLRDSATGSVTYPLDVLRLIRENSGEVTRDLGARQIQGRAARGYVILLKGAHDDQPIEPQEVWVDAETDLPLEFGHEVKNDEMTSVVRFTDFRWNEDIDPQLFDATPPADFLNVTPPSGEEAPRQIADALALYAKLCGHYPQVDSRTETLDADVLRAEMLRRAGFRGEPDPAWKNDGQYRQIERAGAALKEVARVLHNRYHAGYDGLHIGPADKEKVLLWWRRTDPDGLRVFFGDLRTRVISDAEGKTFGLDNWLERQAP